MIEETLLRWSGILFLLISFLFGVLVLFVMLYALYDYFLKRLIGWSNPQIRSDLIFFARNSKKIREFIKKEKEDKYDGKV